MKRPRTRLGGRVPLWAWVVGAGLLLRVLMVLAVPVFPLVANTWDSTYYHETATHLADGEGYTFQGKPTALFPPGFPAALAVAYRIAGSDPRTGQALNVLASMGIVAAGAWLAARTLGRAAARRAAMFLALDPSQIVMPAFLMSEVICALALAVGLAALLHRLRGGRVAWLLLAAASGTFAGFTRGHAFFLLPTVLVGLLVFSRVPKRSVWIALAVVLTVNAAGLGLWAARNREALGHAVPISTNGAMNFLLGNNENARGGRSEPPGGLPATGDEVQDEVLARARAIEYIRTHPARFVALLPVKAGRLLLPAPATTYRAELRAKLGSVPAVMVLAASQLFHVAVWALGLLFLFRRARTSPGPDPAMLRSTILACLGIWTLGHLPFLGGARYFFPVEPLLVIAAAGHFRGLAPLTPQCSLPTV